MVMFCALHDVEAEEREEATMVKDLEGPEDYQPRRTTCPSPPRMCGRRAGAAVVPGIWRQQPHDGLQGSLLELDDDVTGTVKFGDGSRVAIQGRATIIFRC